jgi:hypothetical protein
MVQFLIDQCRDLHLFLSFLTHTIFFLILTFIVFYKNIFCKLHSTVIWYTSLSSLFVSITILIQWIFGVDHPMAYEKINVLSNTIFFINLTLLFFIVLKHFKLVKQQIEKSANY